MDHYQKEAKKILETIPEGERFSWDFKQREIAKQIIRGGGDGMYDFLRWPVSVEALYASYGDHAMYEEGMVPLDVLRLAVDPPVGNSNLPKSPYGASWTYIRQALVAHTIANSYMELENLQDVLEFGGGYGALDVVLRRMGFDGMHFVYDFPIMHLLRDWYLSRNVGGSNFWTVPLTEINDLFVTDAFVSVCAIDETEFDFRDEFMDKVIASFYLFVVTSVYQGKNNKDWCVDFFKNNQMYYEKVMLMGGNQWLYYGR